MMYLVKALVWLMKRVCIELIRLLLKHALRGDQVD